MSTFTIAGLQLNLTSAKDAEHSNFDYIREQVLATARRFPHLDMVILPELSTFGPAPKYAEPLPGPTEQRYQELAVEANLWLCNGSMFERADDQIYNTMSLINPAGEVVCRYRKMYPFTPHEEGISSGSEPKVVDIPGVGRFGLSICYDMWYPETIRSLVWEGAEVILHPTLTNTIDREAETSIARANATMNQCYLIDINAAGTLGVGQSIVAGPGGEVIHQSGSQHDVIVVDLDLAYLRRVRRQGWNGLGQPLKSFRDSSKNFAPYQPGATSKALDDLGPLVKPKKQNWTNTSE
jgi:predicted amidohydrolase